MKANKPAPKSDTAPATEWIALVEWPTGKEAVQFNAGPDAGVAKRVLSDVLRNDYEPGGKVLRFEIDRSVQLPRSLRSAA